MMNTGTGDWGLGAGRKRKLAGLMVALACVWASGCSDDDGPAPTPAPTQTGGPAATATRTSAPANPTATHTSGPAATFTATPEPGQPTNTPGSGPTNTPGGGSSNQATVEKLVSSVLGGLSGLGSLALPTNIGLTGHGSIDFPPIDIPMDIPPVTSDCLVSGQQTISCTTSGGKGNFKISFNNCDNSAGGNTSQMDGDIEVALPGSCLLPSFGNDTPFAVSIDAAINTLSDGNRVNGTFDIAEVVTLRSNGVELTVDGSLDTDCTGPVGIQTTTALFIPSGADCGSQGELVVDISGSRSAVVLTANGGFDIDEGDNGSVDSSFANCQDSNVEKCE